MLKTLLPAKVVVVMIGDELGFRASEVAPKNEDDGLGLSRDDLDHSIGESFPALLAVTSCIVSANGQHRVEHQNTVSRP